LKNAPKDTWYAIGGSSSLDSGDVQPVHILGVERVVWRDGGGESHVWHNRCIHRGMRLQYGFVDGDRLACRYHGWRFAGDGKCAYIPAHPDMTPPDDFCVPSSPSKEAAGLIWTTIGSPDGPPPDLSEFAELTFCRSVAINCASAEVEALATDAEFEPFSGATPGISFSYRHPAPGVIVIEADSGEALILALQPASDTKTHLHVLSAASVAGSDIAALRRHFSSWARQFRWQVENRASQARTETVTAQEPGR
jgi:nitrite reductase/ring-hydroxylating ferredoxin subunit